MSVFTSLSCRAGASDEDPGPDPRPDSTVTVEYTPCLEHPSSSMQHDYKSNYLSGVTFLMNFTQIFSYCLEEVLRAGGERPKIKSPSYETQIFKPRGPTGETATTKWARRVKN